jgi:hypothetical protein
MSAILILLTLWAAVQAPQVPPVPSGPPTQVRPAPRDQRQPAQAGTSVIKGRVLGGDTGRPLRRAAITVTAPELGTENRTAPGSTAAMRSARPDQSGRYQLRGLPPGAYLAVALDYIEEGTWNDAAYLESIRHRAERFALEEAAARTLSQKVVTP